MLAATAASVPAIAFAQAKPAPINDEEAPTTLEAEQMTGRPEREVILEKDVEITRGVTVLNADKVTYDIVEDHVDATGDIRMRRGGDTYTGTELQYKMDTGQGYVLCPTYHLEVNNAQGTAERIDFQSGDEATVTKGTYSTCSGTDPDWYLQSSKLDLDTGRDVGTAYGTVVYFKGVPVLGMPIMTFPLTEERKSGFLPPTIGTSSRSGFEVLTPYYFNIAPNRDLTLYPRVITKRGLQLGARARYLGETYSGVTRIEGMPDDREADRSRYAISSVHNQTFGTGWNFNSNLNMASDQDYPNDFSSTITEAMSRLLARDMSLSYSSGSIWGAAIRASSYQVLQDPRAPIARPYDRLPQISFAASQQDVNGFDWTSPAEFTSFSHPDFVQGERFVVNPKISYPILHPGYFVTPSVSVHATSYSLRYPDEASRAGRETTLNRVVPTVSVNSGLIFERDATFLGAAATQTLEPRLFYVYTPYRDQKDFPVFDSSLADINYAQIFSENRFVGHDLISDANQLTAAVSSRFIEDSGVERMRFALAQRYYFSEQRVVADFTGVPANESRSDLLLSASGQITPALSAEFNMQYSASQRATTQATYGLRWRPAPKHVLNVEYRRDVRPELPENLRLKLIDVSAQWPLSKRWYGVGRTNYYIEERKVAEGLIGLEYKADCWLFRVVGQRRPTAAGVTTTAFFLQLELTGLSKIGSNPLTAIQQNVPGYQLISAP